MESVWGASGDEGVLDVIQPSLETLYQHVLWPGQSINLHAML